MTPRQHAMVLMSLGLLIGCGRGDSSEPWVVDFEAYGPIPLGVAFEDAVAASGGRIGDVEDREGCTMTPLVGGPEGVFLMVVDGRVARVDVRNEGVKTREGAGIGDSEERVQRLYPGAVEVQPHKYTDGHYLVVTPPGASPRRLIFETDGELVTTYRAGVLPEVSWVEGCS